VLGAIFTSHPIVQRLTDYIWLGESRNIDDANVIRLARIFTALRAGIQRLDSYYTSLTLPLHIEDRFFPLSTSFSIQDGQSSRTVNFRYIEPLKNPDPSCVVFLAVNCENEKEKLVVKFVERYGERPHRLLMGQGQAPELLYCGDVWPGEVERSGCGTRKMVVMKFVPGRSGADGLSETARKDIRDALDRLHSAGYVHGDIRPPNILIADAGNRAMILDFDWAGKSGEVKYPFHLSEGIRWAEGVSDYALITQAHDLEMFEKLR
jgi:hypothetical protein